MKVKLFYRLKNSIQSVISVGDIIEMYYCPFGFGLKSNIPEFFKIENIKICLNDYEIKNRINFKTDFILILKVRRINQDGSLSKWTIETTSDNFRYVSHIYNSWFKFKIRKK